MNTAFTHIHLDGERAATQRLICLTNVFAQRRRCNNDNNNDRLSTVTDVVFATHLSPPAAASDSPLLAGAFAS
jgi:hypothetical protein